MTTSRCRCGKGAERCGTGAGAQNPLSPTPHLRTPPYTPRRGVRSAERKGMGGLPAAPSTNLEVRSAVRKIEPDLPSRGFFFRGNRGAR
jgi:hypothetical protein